ncbi:hypothetical protein, partial [Almyronema epifaneia]
IPLNPSEQVASDRPWSDLRDVSELSTTATRSLANAPISSDSRTPIVEINGWVRNAAGQVELIAAAPSHQPLPYYVTCSAASLAADIE